MPESCEVWVSGGLCLEVVKFGSVEGCAWKLRCLGQWRVGLKVEMFGSVEGCAWKLRYLGQWSVVPESCDVWVSGGLCLEVAVFGLEQGCAWKL